MGDVVTPLAGGCEDGADEGDAGRGSIGGSGTFEREAGAEEAGAEEAGADPVPPGTNCCDCMFASSASLMISTMRTTFCTPDTPRTTSVARSVSRRVAMPIR